MEINKAATTEASKNCTMPEQGWYKHETMPGRELKVVVGVDDLSVFFQLK